MVFSLIGGDWLKSILPAFMWERDETNKASIQLQLKVEGLEGTTGWIKTPASTIEISKKRNGTNGTVISMIKTESNTGKVLVSKNLLTN